MAISFFSFNDCCVILTKCFLGLYLIDLFENTILHDFHCNFPAFYFVNLEGGLIIVILSLKIEIFCFLFSTVCIKYFHS